MIEKGKVIKKANLNSFLQLRTEAYTSTLGLLTDSQSDSFVRIMLLSNGMFVYGEIKSYSLPNNFSFFRLNISYPILNHDSDPEPGGSNDTETIFTFSFVFSSNRDAAPGAPVSIFLKQIEQETKNKKQYNE